MTLRLPLRRPEAWFFPAACRPTLEFSKRNRLRGWLHRTYMKLLTGKNELDEEVNFQPEEEIWQDMRRLNGYIDGWIRAAAPDLWKKLQEKWTATCVVGRSRFPSSANPANFPKPWLNPKIGGD